MVNAIGVTRPKGVIIGGSFTQGGGAGFSSDVASFIMAIRVIPTE